MNLFPSKLICGRGILISMALIIHARICWGQQCTEDACITCAVAGTCIGGNYELDSCSTSTDEVCSSGTCTSSIPDTDSCYCQTGETTCKNDKHSPNAMIDCSVDPPQYIFCGTDNIDLSSCTCIPGEPGSSTPSSSTTQPPTTTPCAEGVTSCFSCTEVESCIGGILQISDVCAYPEVCNSGQCTQVPETDDCHCQNEECSEDKYNSDYIIDCSDPNNPQYLNCNTDQCDVCEGVNTTTTQPQPTTSPSSSSTPSSSPSSSSTPSSSPSSSSTPSSSPSSSSTPSSSPSSSSTPSSSPSSSSTPSSSPSTTIPTTTTTAVECPDCGFIRDPNNPCGFIDCILGREYDCPTWMCFDDGSCECDGTTTQIPTTIPATTIPTTETTTTIPTTETTTIIPTTETSTTIPTTETTTTIPTSETTTTIPTTLEPTDPTALPNCPENCDYFTSSNCGFVGCRGEVLGIVGPCPDDTCFDPDICNCVSVTRFSRH